MVSQMSTGDVIVIYVNMFAAFACLVINFMAARTGHPFLRPVRAMVAALLAVYVVAYGWLLTSGDVVAWSRIMRGVSIVAWPVAWGIAPAVSMYVYRKEMEALKELER